MLNKLEPLSKWLRQVLGVMGMMQLLMAPTTPTPMLTLAHLSVPPILSQPTRISGMNIRLKMLSCTLSTP